MSKTLTTSVAFTDPQGNVLANGVIIFQLNMGAKLITNGEVVNVLKVSFTLTSAGLMPGGSTIIANDELMPTGTMYVVTIFNSNGLLVRGPENWILSGASPIDISTITSSSVPDPGLANPIIGNPSAPQVITGQPLTLTSSAALFSNNLTAGNVANKPASADAVRYVSATGNDANDGLSMGSAKATIAGAYSTLPNCTVAPGFYNGSAVASITAPCGSIYIAENAAGYALSSTLTSNGMMVRFIGMGMTPVVINCTTTPCITFNNQSPYANPGLAALYPTDGGLYNLTLNGNGSASQIGVNGLTASFLALKNVIFTNFSGAGANGIVLTNDTPSGGYTEELDWNTVTFNNCTNGVLLTTTGATPNTSFGHNTWRHMQWILGNTQTGWSLSGKAGWYSSFLEGVFNGNDPNGAHTATAISISGTALLTGQFNMPIDNGGGLAINLCTGCTAANFQVYGMIGNTPPNLISRDDAPYFNVTAANYLTSPCWQFNGASLWCMYIDGANQFGVIDAVAIKEMALFFPNAAGGGMALAGPTSGLATIRPAAVAGGTQTIPNATGNFLLSTLAVPSVAGATDLGATSLPWGNLWLGTAATNNFKFQPAGTAAARTITMADPGVASVALPLFGSIGAGGIQAKRVAGCATGAVVGNTCDTTITWTTAFADANYTVTCTGDGLTSGIPSLLGADIAGARAAASVTVRTINNSAAAAQFTTIDCIAIHD